MRNAGGNLAISTPYQASFRVQHFAVPLPSFSILLRRLEKSTLPPGEGIDGRSMTAPTRTSHRTPSPGGGAPRSESLIYMIAGGNHTLIHRCRAQARRMRNAGGNLMKGKPYQASSHIQYFAVPLPSFASLLRRYEKSTLPPGEGICGSLFKKIFLNANNSY